MRLTSSWVVTDPTGLSTVNDICSECKSVEHLHNLLTGTVALNGPRIFRNVRVYVGPGARLEAQTDAEGRLKAQKVLADHIGSMDSRTITTG